MVRGVDMRRPGVEGGVDRDGLQPHAVQSPKDPDSNLAAICHEYPGELACASRCRAHWFIALGSPIGDKFILPPKSVQVIRLFA
jgi:hypothetical protein